MTQTTQASSTHADRFKQSPAVRSAIEAITAELRTHSGQLTDIRGPIDGLGESYESMMARAGATRGRGLFYPYLGSGLGNGPLVELADGSVKWDMISGIGVYFFGHSDPQMMQAALEASLEDTQRQGNLQSTFDAFEFAETLIAEASKSSSLAHCFLSPTGALANENALKICYQRAMPASRVIVFKDCFMGRTATMAQLGDNAAYRVGVPLTVGVDYMPFFDTVAADRIGHTRYIDMALMHLNQYIDRYPGEHAAFVFELVQGEGGFHTSTRDYFKALMECCRANNIAVWDDEIQTFGRTERMFAYEMFDLGELVDVVCVGKMTQVCATLFTEAMNPKPGLLSGTFTGDPAGFAVGRRLIERLRDGGHYGPDGKHARHHKCFTEQVRALAGRHPEWFPPIPEVPGSIGIPDYVGGVGGMMRMTPFGGDKAKIGQACKAIYDEGVILFSCGHGPHHIRMLPPLGVMDEADWPRVFACIERGLAKTAGA